MRGTSRPKAVATEVQGCHPQLRALEGLQNQHANPEPRHPLADPSRLPGECKDDMFMSR